MNGKTDESKEIPEADQSRVFWSGMWSESKEHNRNAEWQKKLKKITIKSRSAWLILRVWFQRRKICRKRWKAPGRDGVQVFWDKSLTDFHERTAFQLNKILNGNEQLAD